MNIDESIIEFKKMIERDKDTLRYWKSDTFGHYDEPIKKLEKDVLISETLLTAYEKEKELLELASNMLDNIDYDQIPIAIGELKLELEKEKEENKRLRKCHLLYEEMTGIDLLLPDKEE